MPIINSCLDKMTKSEFAFYAMEYFKDDVLTNELIKCGPMFLTDDDRSSKMLRDGHPVLR